MTKDARRRTFIEAYDFKVMPRADFEERAQHVPGLVERARQYPGEWVGFDPIDNSDGLMIVCETEAECLEEMANAVLDQLDDSPDHAPLIGALGRDDL